MGSDDGFIPVEGVEAEPAERLEFDDPGALVAISHPPRATILRRLIEEPMTAADLAEALEVPATRLYYHLDLLERSGAIRVVATRRVRGVEERRYRAAAESYALEEAVMRSAREQPEAFDEIIEAVLAGAGAEMRGLAGRIDLASKDQAMLTWGATRLTAGRRTEFLKRLRELLEEFDEGRAGDGERHGLLLAVYPVDGPG